MVHSQESKQKTSLSLKKYHSEHPEAAEKCRQKAIKEWAARERTPRKIVQRLVPCNYCHNTFLATRKDNYGWPTTCSNDCFINTKRRNARGNKQSIYKDERFDSQWEVELAKFLDAHNIAWTRPDCIFWFDANNKQHRYWPDFYLPKHNLYLDPKNPIAIIKQREKLEIVSKQISLIYGNLKTIQEQVAHLPEFESGTQRS
jgi:hypothetical protein